MVSSYFITLTTRFVFLDDCWRLPPLTVVFALLLIIEMFSIRLSEAKENRINVFYLFLTTDPWPSCSKPD